jgi:Tfp pilus assembly protein PilN
MKAVNLIPSEQRAGGGSVTGDSEGGAFLVIGLLAGIAVLALMYGIASHQASTRKSEVANVTAEAQAAQARASELAPYVSFKALYQARLQAVSELAGTRFDWAHAFHEIGRVLPADASLSTIHGTVGSATSTGTVTTSSSGTPASATVASATPPGAVPTFSLAGCATSQSEVAEVLQRLRLINGVSAVTLQSSTKTSTGGGGNGTCPTGDPAFAAEVTFSPLPTPATAPGASTTTAATTSPSATSPATTAPSTASPSTPSAGGAQ